MALNVSLTKKDLKAKCELLNIKPKEEYKKDSKDSYSYAIREYYIDKYYKGSIPNDLELMLQLESPMCAAQLKTCKEDLQKKIWESQDYYMEEKLDGVRQLLFFMDNKFTSYSRNLSDIDLLPINYGNKVYMECDFTKLQHTFILDSECVSMNPNISTIIGKRGVWTETQLQAVQALLSMNAEDSIRLQKEQNAPLKFVAFDCLYYDGEWLLDYPLIERRKYLKKAIDELRTIGFKVELPLSNMSNKKAFYKKIINEGGEGCFHSRTKVTMADGTFKNIKDIQVGDLVKTYNFSKGIIESKKVLKVFDNGLKDIEHWVRVSHNKKHSSKSNMSKTHNYNIICTKNHKFYYNGSWCDVVNLNNCMEFRLNINRDLKQVFLGMLASDGNISNRGFRWCQSVEHQDYYKDMVGLFKNFISKESKSISGKGSNMLHFHINVLYCRDVLKDYVLETSDGFIDLSLNNIDWCKIFDSFDIISLSHFFMGDGYGDDKGIEFSLYSYSVKEVEHFQKMLVRLGCKVDDIRLKQDTRISNKNNQSGIKIRLTKECSKYLAVQMKPFLSNDMLYKIDKLVIDDVVKYKYNFKEFDLVEVPLYKEEIKDSIIYKGQKKYRAYDLEIEDNHNYFVGGNVLVHNCVAKYIYGTYHATTSRAHREWIKLKRSMSESLTEEGGGDTIDGFITGFLQGNEGKAYADMVGALQVSCYVQDEFGRKRIHHIATISAFDLELRKDMTEYDENNQPRLKQEYYNKVVEIDGVSVSARTKRLRHAVLIRFRPDKNREDCVLEESFLNSMIL